MKTMCEVAIDTMELGSANHKDKVLHKGDLVMSERTPSGKYRVTSLDGKFIGLYGNADIKKCPCTCKEDETLVAVFSSGYHEYMAIGRNIETIAKQIAEMYSKNCREEKRKSFKAIAIDEYGCEYSICIYKAPMDQLYFDDEYFGPHEKDFVEIGDFLSKYHKTPTSKKDYFYNKKW